jgi:hypothetical protein
MKKKILHPRWFSEHDYNDDKKPGITISKAYVPLKGLSHEMDFINVDKN